MILCAIQPFFLYRNTKFLYLMCNLDPHCAIPLEYVRAYVTMSGNLISHQPLYYRSTHFPYDGTDSTVPYYGDNDCEKQK